MNLHWTKKYVSTVTAVMAHPGAFFQDRFNNVTVGQALGFLSLSALCFSITATLVNPVGGLLRNGVLLFVNAIGMVVIGSAVAYVALIATTGRRYAFFRLWNIFSLSASAVLILAWIPAAFFLTEPWRWWLIGTGLVRGLGLSKIRAVFVVLLTFIGMAALICTVFSMVEA